MTVTVRDARSSPEDRAWIRAVYPDYLSGLAGTRGSTRPALAEWGIRDDEPLSDWFSDYAAQPLVLIEAGRRVGFALVSRAAQASAGPMGADSADYRLSEFFVIPSERRRGIGADAATQIFAFHDGRWEVCEDERNAAAVQFWRRVIGELTAGSYRERRTGGEVRQSFRCVGGASIAR